MSRSFITFFERFIKLFFLGGYLLYIYEVSQRQSNRNLRMIDLTENSTFNPDIALLALDTLKQDNQELTKIARKTTAVSKFNILLMGADDLAAVFGPYVKNNHPLADEGLASQFYKFVHTSTVFRATSIFSVCGPSRASAMTGRYPDRLKIWNFEQFYPQANNPQTIFAYYKRLGYKTFLSGKMFHQDYQNGKSLAFLTGQLTDMPTTTDKGNSECSNRRYWCTINPAHSADTKVFNAFKKFLSEMRKNQSQPFIAGVGFHRPHLSIAYPAAMAKGVRGDLPNTNIPQISGAADYEHSFAHREDVESDNYKILFGNRWQPVVNGKSGRKSFFNFMRTDTNQNAIYRMRQAYYAGVRFVLNSFGKTIDALNAYGFTNNTIVVVFSDHGWQLGEAGEHGKNGLRTKATNIPLIIRKPGQRTGFINWNPVSQVDIFPTLIALTDGPAAVTQFNDGSGMPLDGVSLLQALTDPNHAPNEFVVSQYPRCQALGTIQTADCMTAVDGKPPCNAGGGRPKINVMGYVLVHKNGDRYTEWRNFNEERTNCAKATWPNMPESIRDGWGYLAWQMDRAKSCTNWNKDPMQPELYHNNDDTTENYAFQPDTAERRLMTSYSGMLKTRFSSLACRAR